VIPAALRALTAHQQFILYRLEPSKTRIGKSDKIPCDYRTGKPASALERANWTEYEIAEAAATNRGEGWGVGFVLTENDPFFCLDVDNCLQADGKTWSPIVGELCAKLPGVGLERSRSGQGVHMWGRYSGAEPTHGFKNIAQGLELYTSKHFIALGFNDGWPGDASKDCTSELQAVIAEYFPPKTVQDATVQEWTTEPCAEWHGPSDDGLLIDRAIRSHSAADAFGNKASFADLWEAKTEELSRAYPAEGRPYDASSADAALAQRLAFWTGKDCERIRRLMKRSALARDKWNREDYLPRTILGAVSRQDKVYVDKVQRRQEQVEENLRIGDGSDVLPPSGKITLDEMINRYAYVIDGKQVIDLEAPQRLFVLDEWKSAFKASRTEAEVERSYNSSDGTPKTKNCETSKLWEMNPQRLQVDTVTFRPGFKLLTQDPQGRQAVNTWKPIERSATAGDPSLFLNHVEYLFGPDAPRLLDWLAHIEQRPGELPHSGWVHISPSQGTGRNWLASVLCRLWSGYVAANFDLSGTLRTGFNGSLSRKLLAVVDEINEGGSNARWENAETLKSLITSEHRRINPKYGHERVEYNVCRWLIFSNHTSALPLNESDRRFNVVRNDAAPMSSDYYKTIYAALRDREFIKAVAQLLRTRDISSFNPGEHAALSEAKRELIAASRSETDETLIQLVASCPSDVIPSSTLGALLTGVIGGKVTPAHRRAIERAGIRAHGVRIRVGINSTRVCILRNHPRWKEADPRQIRAELEKLPSMLFGNLSGFLDQLPGV
jgi:primase-polymerase (primpol)-like protein